MFLERTSVTGGLSDIWLRVSPTAFLPNPCFFPKICFLRQILLEESSGVILGHMLVRSSESRKLLMGAALIYCRVVAREVILLQWPPGSSFLEPLMPQCASVAPKTSELFFHCCRLPSYSVKVSGRLELMFFSELMLLWHLLSSERLTKIG